MTDDDIRNLVRAYLAEQERRYPWRPLGSQLPQGYSVHTNGRDIVILWALDTGEPDEVYRWFEVGPPSGFTAGEWSLWLAEAEQRIEQHRQQRKRDALRLAQIVIAPFVKEVPLSWAEMWQHE